MFNIALKEAKEFFRSPVAVFMTLFFPAVLIFVLGTMLEFLDVSDFEIGEIKLQYTINGDNTYSKEAFESFITEFDMFDAEKAQDNETALSLTDSGELNAFVEYDGNDIKLYTGDNSTINRALDSVFGSYLQMADTYIQIAEVNPSALSSVLAEDFSDKSFTEQKGLGVTRSMIDYYAVSIIVMMIFMSCITGQSETFKEEKNNNTYARIAITPTSKYSIFFGKVIGSMPVPVTTVAVTMIIASVVFGAKYCADLLGNMLLVIMLISLGLAASAIGTLLGLVSKIPAVSFIMPVCWSMLFFSGSYSKEIFVEGFSNYLPPYLIQQAAFNLTLFGNTTPALIVTSVCLAIFIIATAVGALIFSNKKAV